MLGYGILGLGVLAKNWNKLFVVLKQKNIADKEGFTGKLKEEEQS
ncbi:hypothetical protein SAMN05444394_0525 [Algoriphagus halophilus]|uniref:Uncharacterized protein n=1 Tax=Algoriphagus halophilus TaxID=226505 RepID=A0A1N6D948_9BACT|nr:hypothetical protein SAMN05444394_0525 [Algoriphagus halophilus]